FDAAARAIAASEEIFGAYALVKESELAKLRQEFAGAHRSFDREIRARDSMITEATAYARSLEQSRDEALRYARALETR
ncbi:hypothetical protein, partial [Enterobacter asburiae]|uniref:hypothetical protein n=1 Tax=Enterobacter asburiae TaxID=61645 RepID=UPI0013D0BBD5